MPGTELTATATFENGVLWPDQPLPLAPHQRVTLIIQIPAATDEWPENVAEIYRDMAGEDRRLADAMWGTVQETWPVS